jgi:hypothetical protein
LANLGYHDRAGLTKDAIEAAVGALPDNEAERIDGLATRLSEQFKGLGPVSALEVLAAIGMLWSDDEQEQ